jgi:hypothetical protein
MNWYKCYDEKAGKWVEPDFVEKNGMGNWDTSKEFREFRCGKAYRETGISVNGSELIEGDKLTCTNPLGVKNETVDGIVSFNILGPILQCEHGYYILDHINKSGIVRTGHISGEGR